MKKNYQIKTLAQPSLLSFTIRRKHMNSANISQQLHTSISTSSLNPQVLAAFGSFESFCQSVVSHPQNVTYDDLQLCVVIQFKMIGCKYMYLPIAEIQSEKVRNYGELLINLQEAVSHLQYQMNLHIEGENFDQKVKEIYQVEANYQTSQSQLNKIKANSRQVNGRVHELFRKAAELDRQIGQLDPQQAQKNVKEMTVKTRRQMYLQELQRKDDEEVKRLLNCPQEQVTGIHLTAKKLRSMMMVYLFTNLQEISLPKNDLTRIEGLQRLQLLTHLDLSQNRIESMQGLQKSFNLKALVLYSNRITKVKNIFQLRKLQVLSLSLNYIKSIPAKIQQLSSLVELRLVNNQINYLPRQLLKLKKLKVFAIFCNPCFSSTHKSNHIIDTLIQKQDVHTISFEF